MFYVMNRGILTRPRESILTPYTEKDRQFLDFLRGQIERLLSQQVFPRRLLGSPNALERYVEQLYDNLKLKPADIPDMCNMPLIVDTRVLIEELCRRFNVVNTIKDIDGKVLSPFPHERLGYGAYEIFCSTGGYMQGCSVEQLMYCYLHTSTTFPLDIRSGLYLVNIYPSLLDKRSIDLPGNYIEGYTGRLIPYIMKNHVGRIILGAAAESTRDPQFGSVTRGRSVVALDEELLATAAINADKSAFRNHAG